MSDLKSEKCEACHADAPTVSDDELKVLMRQIPEWVPQTDGGLMRLQREFKFKNFKKAWEMCDKVAALAEEEFHHPTLVLEWGKLTVSWWTHAIGGLHRNDFIMAARTDEFYDQ